MSDTPALGPLPTGDDLAHFLRILLAHKANDPESGGSTTQGVLEGVDKVMASCVEWFDALKELCGPPKVIARLVYEMIPWDGEFIAIQYLPNKGDEGIAEFERLNYEMFEKMAQELRERKVVFVEMKLTIGKYNALFSIEFFPKTLAIIDSR